MQAYYLIRLDDACPTMSKNWDRIEMLLDTYGIKPMVAVIPDNQDTEFFVEPVRTDFWDRVKRWQDKGWAIAMHGYQHLYSTDQGGLVPINKKSEFSGVPLEDQREKIKKGWNIFKINQIEPTIWIAPAHSFDNRTIQVILEETSITTISDGISVSPFFEKGMFWIPQQLWRFRKFPFGIFTICLHPAMMQEDDFVQLEQDLKNNRNSFISADSVPVTMKKRSVLDKVFMILWWYVFRGKKQ